MDNQRPELDLRHFNDICPDQNGALSCVFPMIYNNITHRFPVPVIAVFTKYDQFLRNVEMHLEDYGNPDDDLSDAVDTQFKEHYLAHLGDGARFVQLESLLFSIKYRGRVLIPCDRNAQNRRAVPSSSRRDG
jgi:hypothetical protein